MKRVIAIAAAIACLAIAGSAVAQDYPSRPITWVVPFPPGGVTDNGARTVAKVLSEKLGQPVIIENKPGAGGIVGTEYVVNSKPDGYTFLYASNGALVTYQFLYKKLSYDPQTSLIPVHGMADSPMLMMVRSDAPYKTLAEFVDYAKKNPDKMNYFSVGNGSTQHLATELLLKEAGIKMAHIPYKGSSPGLTDLLGGVIDVMFDYAVVMKPQIDAGKLRPIAVAGPERVDALPDVPTLQEAGVDVELTNWRGVVAPKGITDKQRDALEDLITQMIESDSWADALDREGWTDAGTGAEVFGEFIVSEQERVDKIVDELGIGKVS